MSNSTISCERIYQINRCFVDFFKAALNASDIAKEYLYSRKISDAAISEFEIGFAPTSWDDCLEYGISCGFSLQELIESTLVRKTIDSKKHYSFFRQRVIFPMKDEHGNYVGFHGRDLSKPETSKYIFPSNSPVFDREKLLYRFFESKKAILERDEVIVCEGAFDAMALYSSGYPNSIAMLGTAIGMSKIETILRHTRNIVWALDSDYAGKMGTARILNDLLGNDSSNKPQCRRQLVEPQKVELNLSSRFRMATFPDSVKDPAAYFEQYGAEELANCIKLAPEITAPIPVEDIKRPIY